MSAFNSWRRAFTAAGGSVTPSDSTPITGLAFGSPYKYNAGYPAKYANGDVWYNTWADDGEIYAACGDFVTGWSGTVWNGTGPIPNYPYTAISHLDGFTNSLTGTMVNTMRILGVQNESGSDGAGFNYKPSGLISVDGILYLAAARQKYGTVGTDWIQSSVSCQLMKSSDHGANWTPVPSGNSQPFASPMFNSTRFGAPGFIHYATADYQGNTEHNSDLYVYAVSPDGVWNNGNNMILGRCLITDMPNLDGSDWSYYTGGNGMSDSAWSSNMNDAALIISKTKGVGMTTVQFIPFCRRYLMVQWYYKSIYDGTTFSTLTTVWDVYEAEFPWGPWTLVQSNTWNPKGFYTPVVIQKSITVDDGQNIQLVFSGDYTSQSPVNTADYQFTLMATEVLT